ncbi:MAG: GHKL domain-containing protein [Synergistaceae bacterium]|nr:GHKL domain-containing protein [Synergistaceae bacterium]
MIFLRYLAELLIIIPDSLYIFMMLTDDFRRASRKARTVSGVILPVFAVIAAWVCSKFMLPVIPALVVSVAFLFAVFFLTVKISLGRMLFCFFTAIMLGAFCLLYSIAVMAGAESVNELWHSVRLLSIEAGLTSLGLSVVAGLVFFRAFTSELPALLKDENVSGLWDFLFLVPLGATLVIAWLTPIWPGILLIGRSRAFLLVLQPLIPLVVLLIYHLLWRLSVSAGLRQENTLLAMEGKRYEELRSYMEGTRAMRHDFRQHILVITRLASSGEISGLMKYLEQFGGDDAGFSGYCENIAADAVASHYASCAEKQATRITWSLNIPRQIPVSESEYCAILGNLLENALHAVRNLPEGQREVTVISSLITPSIIGLSVDNPYSGQIVFGADGLPKSGREGHGLGLVSVAGAVRRNHGTLSIRTEGGVFSADVVLFCGA